jgi:pimeloyl-ACP methyl ester carboxylesterase
VATITASVITLPWFVSGPNGIRSPAHNSAYRFATGFGGSERYPEMNDETARPGSLLGGASQAEQIARVVTYWRSPKATRVSIVAHSRSTIPAGIFTMQHPELVDRLAFFGPVAQRQLEILPDGLPSSTSARPQWRLVTTKNQHDRFVAEVPKGHDPVLLDRHFQLWARAYIATDPDQRRA